MCLCVRIFHQNFLFLSFIRGIYIYIFPFPLIILFFKKMLTHCDELALRKFQSVQALKCVTAHRIIHVNRSVTHYIILFQNLSGWENFWNENHHRHHHYRSRRRCWHDCMESCIAHIVLIMIDYTLSTIVQNDEKQEIHIQIIIVQPKRYKKQKKFKFNWTSCKQRTLEEEKNSKNTHSNRKLFCYKYSI